MGILENEANELGIRVVTRSELPIAFLMAVWDYNTIVKLEMVLKGTPVNN